MTISNLGRLPGAQRRRIEAMIATERAKVGPALDADVAASGDVAEVRVTDGDAAIADVIESALLCRSNAIDEARAHVRMGLVSTGILAFSGVAAYLALCSDQHWGWKLAIACPTGLVALLSLLFIVGCIGAFYIEIYDRMSWKGEAWNDAVAQIGYRAGSAWQLGQRGIHTRGSQVYVPDWAISSKFVAFEDVYSVVLLESRNMVALIDGSKHGTSHFLCGIDVSIEPYGVVAEILRRSRAVGVDIERMTIASDGIDKEKGDVTENVLTRFMTSFPGWSAKAENSYGPGTIAVEMTRSDEIALFDRVASFEGHQVVYLVPRKSEDQPVGTEKEIIDP